YVYRFCCRAAVAVNSSVFPSGEICCNRASRPIGTRLNRLRIPSKTISTGLGGAAAGGGVEPGEFPGPRPPEDASLNKSRNRSSRNFGVFSTRSTRTIWLSSVRWLVSNRRYVPSGDHNTEPLFVLERKLTCRGSPPAAGVTHKLRNPRSPSFR